MRIKILPKYRAPYQERNRIDSFDYTYFYIRVGKHHPSLETPIKNTTIHNAVDFKHETRASPIFSPSSENFTLPYRVPTFYPT